MPDAHIEEQLLSFLRLRQTFRRVNRLENFQVESVKGGIA
jgi:hypothetical protein